MRPRRGRLSIRRRRLHLLLLGLIVAVGLARGLYWVAVTEVFNPVDERAHYAYVESMARHLRPPVVGRDRLSPDALRLVKDARTSYWRSAPLVPTPDDEAWGAVAESYEGVQGPLYYLLMAAPYRLARPHGLLASLYTVRAASVLLSLLSVPIAYALARELFPRRREVWLAAPALLVILQGFNGNLASVSNDALVVPLAGGALLAFCRTARRGLDPIGALATGGLVGLGLATKSNMVALVPMIGIGAVGVTMLQRLPWARLARWTATVGVATVAVVAPWLAWNLATYGSPSPSAEVDRITGPMQPDYPFTLGGVREHLVSSTVGFWDFQLVGPRMSRYMVTVSVAAVVILLAGLVVSVARHRRGEATVLGWLGSSYAITAATMVAVIYGVFAGRSSTVGRHMYPALIAVVIAVAGAAFAAGRRYGGWLALTVLANVALAAEPPLVHRMVELTYGNAIVGSLAPVVEQTWGEGLVSASSVTMDPPCPAEAFGVGFSAPPPSAVHVVGAAGPLDAPFLGLQGTPAQRIAVYTLPAPLTEPFELVLGGVPVSASADDRDPHLALPGEPGDPVARIFCRVEHPDEVRFRQQFTPDHPSWIRLAHVTGWPTAWAWIGRAAFVALVGCALHDRRRRARTDRPRRAPRAARPTCSSVASGTWVDPPLPVEH